MGAPDMEVVMLDTSIWIDAFRGRSPEILQLTRKLINEDRVCTCGPIVFEIRRGLRMSEQKRVLPLFDALIRVKFDESTWEAAGTLDASLRKKGATIPPMDILIASVCLEHGTPLWTLDQHFEKIPGLKWFTSGDLQ